jgi:hypothetical protein
VVSIFHVDSSKKSLSIPELDINNIDPSINGSKAPSLEKTFGVNLHDFDRIFFSPYNIEYIGEYFSKNKYDLRVVTHPEKTNTCFEKAKLLGQWDPLNIIKVFYFANVKSKYLYAVVIPETGCFIDKKRIMSILEIKDEDTFKKASVLPVNMSYGTCSPFITSNDIDKKGWVVKRVVFDSETLGCKKTEKMLDDFSFGLDHRMSVQMNYYHCYEMLNTLYPNVTINANVLNLSFKEKFIREKGRIKIFYNFSSMNYRTAKFVNSIHGYGDVTIENDYVDELYLPDVLITTPPVK